MSPIAIVLFFTPLVLMPFFIYFLWRTLVSQGQLPDRKAMSPRELERQDDIEESLSSELHLSEFLTFISKLLLPLFAIGLVLGEVFHASISAVGWDASGIIRFLTITGIAATSLWLLGRWGYLSSKSRW
jgi:hypothetical protein